MRPERRLPADSSLPGHTPAQLARCLAGREGVHVAAGLSDDDLGGAPLDAGDRAQQLDRGGERGDLLFDRLGELGDRLVEVVDVGKDPPANQSVLGLEATLQRLAQRGQLGAQLALGELGEHSRVGGAGDQRGEHRAAALAEQVRGDAVELDAGVFHELVQPAGLPLPVTDLRLAIARQVAQRADRLGRHQAAAQQAGLSQPANPLRV